MVLVNIINNFNTKTCGFGTFHWWRIPCYTQDLLGWKECSFASRIKIFLHANKDGWKTLTNRAKWFKTITSYL